MHSSDNIIHSSVLLAESWRQWRHIRSVSAANDVTASSLSQMRLVTSAVSVCGPVTSSTGNVTCRDHGLRGSASPVLTATGFVNRRWQFSTPHRVNTPIKTDHQKIWYRWLRRRPLRLRQIWCKSVHEGLLGKWVKYNENYTYLFIYLYHFYTFFYQLTYRSDATTDFHAWWLKRRGLAQGCAFWGFRWYFFTTFWVWNTTKTPILGRE